MCSFLFLRTKSSVSQAALHQANYYQRFRGPDYTKIRQDIGFDKWCLTYIHNLLDISGNNCSQPVTSGGNGSRLELLFNGEIYNYSSLVASNADTECILPLFRQYGVLMSSYLDGEYAILIYDESKNAVYIFTDPFLTKPLFLGLGRESGDFGASTAPTTLRSLGFKEIQMVKPNSVYEILFSNCSVEINISTPIVKFDLRQYKTSFKDWQNAFLDSVKKRATHGAHKPAVFLSSGYDSGGICAALNFLGLPYDTFSINAGESHLLLRNRISINQKHSCERSHLYHGISYDKRAQIKSDICSNVENFRYFHEDSPGVVNDLHNDHGAVGASFLASKARNYKNFVILSGSGADEILSDYGFNGKKFYYHSQFGGHFPQDLEGFFPWKKFYADSQRSYLFKDEFILGRHGLEGRYPFLDKQLVQEFLWLTPELKNSVYKAPLAIFLSGLNYPFEAGVKRGFCPDQDQSQIHLFFQRASQKLTSRGKQIFSLFPKPEI